MSKQFIQSFIFLGSSTVFPFCLLKFKTHKKNIEAVTHELHEDPWVRPASQLGGLSVSQFGSRSGSLALASFPINLSRSFLPFPLSVWDTFIGGGELTLRSRERGSELPRFSVPGPWNAELPDAAGFSCQVFLSIG